MSLDNSQELRINGVNLRELYNRDSSVYTQLGGTYWMPYDELHFIIKTIQNNKVTKALEIGVSGGMTSSFMLRAMKEISKESTLYGIDICSDSYIGFCVNHFSSDLTPDFKIHRGANSLSIENVFNDGEKLDMVFIDAGHVHPQPLIDLLCSIPFLKKGGIILLHDIVDYYTANAWGETFIFNAWPDELKARAKNLNSESYGNIGAIKMPETEDQLMEIVLKVAKTPFKSSPWPFKNYGLGFDETDLAQLKLFTDKYYPKYSQSIIEALETNLDAFGSESLYSQMETKFMERAMNKASKALNKVCNLSRVGVSTSTLRDSFRREKKYAGKKICFYGAGEFAEYLSKNTDLKALNPICFIDSNPLKTGKNIDGIEIRNITELETINPDILFITALEGHSVLSELQNNEVIKKLGIELAIL